MAHSASKLKSTRSGVVSSDFLRGMSLFAPAAPVPPLTLFSRQERIPGLSDRCGENIQAADVVPLPGDAAEFGVKPSWILPAELRHAADAQQLEIAQHG